MQRAMPFTLFQLPPKYDACGGLNFQILRLSSKNAFILLSSTFTLFKCNSEANHRSRTSCSMDFAVENSCITSSLFDAILWFKFPHFSSVFCVCFRISGNKLFSLYYSHLLHSVEDGMWQLQGRVCCPTRERTFCTLEVLALGRCSMPEETKVISVRFCPTKTEKNAQCLQSRITAMVSFLNLMSTTSRRFIRSGPNINKHQHIVQGHAIVLAGRVEYNSY